jgi:hypothetical protein
MILTRRGEWLLLLAVAVAARAITFGNPAVHIDEQFYYVTAEAMTHGAWPYADIWDRKPVGLFLLYLPAALVPLPWGILAYQAMALVSAVTTAWLIARMARMARWRPGSTLAGIAYLLWINLAEGQGGQSPIFYNTLIAGAALLICGRRCVSTRRGLASMALVGLALQVKYSVVFEGIFFGVWIVTHHAATHRRPYATLRLTLALIALALLPTIAATATYAAAGRLDAFWYANFQSIFARRPDFWAERLRNLIGIGAILSPLLAMAGVTCAQHEWNADRLFLFGWLAAALAGFLAFGTWFEHYGLPVMVPAAICSAGAMGGHRHVRRWALPILAVVAIGGQALLVIKLMRRGSPAQFRAVADAVGRGPGCLWVFSGEPMLYPWTGRCRATRYIFPSHLSRDREEGAIGIDEKAEIRRIFARRPAAIVIRPPAKGERADIRVLVLAGLAEGYREKAAIRQGKLLTRVYVPR